MRRLLALLAVVLLGALAACQEYQFTPVGRCLLQPSRLTVANVSTVDVLFVVDDSLSMQPIQASLASNFGTFIDRVAQKQQERVTAGQEPFEFHIAVTTTSVLVNRYIAANGSCGRVKSGKCSIDAVTKPPDDRTPYEYDCKSGPSDPTPPPCGDVVEHYYNYVGGTCSPGVLQANGEWYPRGAFVAAGSNPKVLSFTKDLNWANAAGDAKLQDLMAKFKQNVQVGSCGANQEMPFEAAKRAIQKALANQQGLGGGLAWPHPDSKIMVVFVGDEDDCSTKSAREGGLVWDGGQAGADTCHADAQRPKPERLTTYQEYESFLSGLGHPLSVAFVRPGFAGCGVSGSGARMHALATALKNAKASVVEASVCADFAATLEQIADELPSSLLKLPSTPAASDVTRLRVTGSDGKKVHVCDGPGTAREWWFVDCATGGALEKDRTGDCVQLKPNGGCEPGPGQTLVAEYLGRVPASGCADRFECATVLGGSESDYSCEGATAAQKGTCVCAQP